LRRFRGVGSCWPVRRCRIERRPRRPKRIAAGSERQDRESTVSMLGLLLLLMMTHGMFGVSPAQPQYTRTVWRVQAPRELTNNFVRGFLETRRGEVWIGTDEGLSHLTPQGMRKLTMKDGLVHFSIRSLFEDHTGDVWIGTEQGLSHWHEARSSRMWRRRRCGRRRCGRSTRI
jgi:hypothetical protein